MKFIIKLLIVLVVLDFMFRTVYDLGIESGKKQCTIVYQENSK